MSNILNKLNYEKDLYFKSILKEDITKLLKHNKKLIDYIHNNCGSLYNENEIEDHLFNLECTIDEMRLDFDSVDADISIIDEIEEEIDSYNKNVASGDISFPLIFYSNKGATNV